MKRFILVILILSVVIGFSGCATSLGQLTVASTHNVRNLNYTSNEKVRVSGSACARNIFGIPISQQDDLLQRSIDDAIRDGQSSFIGKEVDGDLLVNVRITYEPTTFLIYNDLCYSVEGDLVKIDTK
jgi:hypothetical protein